jgi:astacin (peptidase family M12A)
MNDIDDEEPAEIQPEFESAGTDADDASREERDSGGFIRLDSGNLSQDRQRLLEAAWRQRSSEAQADDDEARNLWQRFLSRLQETPRGGFAIDDILLPDEASVLQYFEMLSGTRVEKGLLGGGTSWPEESCGGFCMESPSIHVCWTPDSDASTGDKELVERMVQSTWGGSALIDFIFRDGSGNFRTCQDVQCGFFRCYSGTDDIKLFHTSALPSGGVNGCSRLGTQHQNPSGYGSCAPGTPVHDYATMYLPTGNYQRTIVHEFGHAIGLLHEHLRDELVPNAGTCNTIVNDRNNTRPLFTSQGCTSNCINDIELGAYDPLSIMHYCTDAFGLLTLDDVENAQSVYFGRAHEVRFEHSSWYSDQVRLGFASSLWTVSSTSAPASLATGINDTVGDTYSVSVEALNDPRLTCSVTKPPPAFIREQPLVVPTTGFDDTPILATCYDAAAMVAIARLTQ